MSKSKKKQFTGTSAPKSFFDRKLSRQGQTKVLSVGKVLPKTWTFVRIEVIERTDDGVMLKLTRLLESTEDAQASTTHQVCE